MNILELFLNLSIFLLILAAIILIIPGAIAFKRKHSYKWIILLLGFFGGGISGGILWLVAFVWSIWPKDKSLADPVIGSPTGLSQRNTGDTIGNVITGVQRGYANDNQNHTKEAENSHNSSNSPSESNNASKEIQSKFKHDTDYSIKNNSSKRYIVVALTSITIPTSIALVSNYEKIKEYITNQTAKNQSTIANLNTNFGPIKIIDGAVAKFGPTNVTKNELGITKFQFSNNESYYTKSTFYSIEKSKFDSEDDEKLKKYLHLPFLQNNGYQLWLIPKNVGNHCGGAYSSFVTSKDEFYLLYGDDNFICMDDYAGNLNDLDGLELLKTSGKITFNYDYSIFLISKDMIRGNYRLTNKIIK
ncbi:MAG: hypothetical protein RJA34_1643 [Pseudomonadota bacterium]|jgi:hypothetical protein